MTLMIETTKIKRFNKGFRHFRSDSFLKNMHVKKWLFNRPTNIDFIINRKLYE